MDRHVILKSGIKVANRSTTSMLRRDEHVQASSITGRRSGIAATISPEAMKNNQIPLRDRWKIDQAVTDDLKVGLIPAAPGQSWVRGHLMADQLGGQPQLLSNFVPMTAKANRTHLDIENRVAKIAYDGKLVNYQAIPDYTAPPLPHYATNVPPIPSRLKVTYTVMDAEGMPVTVTQVIENL